jgi:hypothetical protein
VIWIWLVLGILVFTGAAAYAFHRWVLWLHLDHLVRIFT